MVKWGGVKWAVPLFVRLAPFSFIVQVKKSYRVFEEHLYVITI
jgi:hypothetical protein